MNILCKMFFIREVIMMDVMGMVCEFVICVVVFVVVCNLFVGWFEQDLFVFFVIGVDFGVEFVE